MTEELDKRLEHYGVKGMRWGVRKKPKRRSRESRDVKRLSKKPARELTNEQLARATKRLNLEKNFKSATETTASRGRRAVGKILANAAATILTTLLVSEGTKMAYAAFKKKRGG